MHSLYHILHVEDEEFNSRLVKKMFKGTHYHITSVPDATSGLSVAIQTKPDIMLIDLFLPDMTGIDLLHEIRRTPSLHQIPAIILTADSSTMHRERTLAYGNTAFVSKPVARWHLIQTIEQFVTAPV